MTTELSQYILGSVPSAMRHIRKMAFAEADDSISIPQLRILASINEGFDQVSTLAKFMGVSQAAISKMVDGMVERELISRSDTDDRRVTRLKLTKKGETLNNKLHSSIEQKIDVFIKDLSKTEKDDLKAGLKVLSKVFSSEKLL